MSAFSVRKSLVDRFIARSRCLAPPAVGVFKTKIFQNFVLLRFDAKLLCFDFVSIQINFLSEEFCFVVKS